MSTTAEVLNALVDLRAIARGSNTTVRMWTRRPERRAPIQVEISCGTLLAPLRRGEDAVDIIHGMIHALERCNVTRRQYEDDPPLR